MFFRLCYPKSEKLELCVDDDPRGAKEAQNILNVINGVEAFASNADVMHRSFYVYT